MAEVYRVKSIGLAGFEKIQALKRILPDSAQEERFIRSFIDEARIAVELNHRNIVSVFDFGKSDDGELYLAMELIDGKDLRNAVGDGRERDWPIPPEVAAYVISEVAAGLDYAHRKTDGMGGAMGIVHCDISPSNIMLSYDGAVKILDFGIARASFASALERKRLRGKPRYMAPEQTRGNPPTAATDVFALGIITWELFAGQQLFRGPDLKAILDAVRNTVPPRLDALGRGVSRDLADAVAQALAPEPAARGTVNELGIACGKLGMLAGPRGLVDWLARTNDADADLAPMRPTGSAASISMPGQRISAPLVETGVATRPTPVPPMSRSKAPSTPYALPLAVPRSATVTMALGNAVEGSPSPRAGEATAELDAAAHAQVAAVSYGLARGSAHLDAAAEAARREGGTASADGAGFDPNATHTAVLDDGSQTHGRPVSDAAATPAMALPPVTAALAPRAMRADAMPRGASFDGIDDASAQDVDFAFGEQRRFVLLHAIIDGGSADVARMLARTLGELAFQRGGIALVVEERGLMVAFGLQIAGEDDVAAAMGWSLDASTLVRDSSDRALVGLRIGARAGVQTTGGGSGMARIPSEALDDVRALARDAVPERPLFTGATGRLSSALYQLREVPRRTGLRRGKLHELLGPRSFDERDRVLFERRGRFIGRTRELAEAEAQFRLAAQHEHRRTILLRGAVGCGKSRLVAELVARLTVHYAPAVIVASASGGSQLAPFGLIVEMCQALVGTPPARGRAARTKLSQLIAGQLRAAGYPDDRARGFATDLDRAMELRDGSGIGALEPADMRSRVAVAFEAIRAVRVGRGRGVLMVIEDLHNADAASVEVLRHALALRAHGAELLVLTARATEPLPHCDVVLDVPDLVGGELRALIIDRLAEAATPLNVAAVLARAGGNPLFIEELASAVAQDADEIPATARDVVAARIDRLSATAKTALRYAAVMAGAVRARLLEELMETDLSVELEALAAERLLVRSDAASVEANEGELHFPRGLVREVVYEALAPRAQRDTHARVGRLLAARFFAGREEPPALIAEHLERGGEVASAAAFWVRAGRLALAAHDATGAVAHFTRVLDLEAMLGGAPATPASRARRREALLGREAAHRLQGDLQAHQSDLEELAELCRDDAPRMADVAARAAQRALRSGDYAAALRATYEAEAWAGQAALPRFGALALRLRAEAYERQGQFDEALALVEQARAQFAACGEVSEETSAMVGAGRIHLMRSHYVEAQMAYAPVLQRLRHGSDPWLERIVKLHMAAIQMSLGNFIEAAHSAERGLELCRRYGDRAREGDALSVLAIVRSEAGLYDEALATFEMALETLARTNSRWSHTDCLIYAGGCAARRGLREGLERIADGLIAARQIGAQYLEANALVTRAGAYLAFDMHDAAIADGLAGAELAHAATLTGAEVLGQARLAHAFALVGRVREAAAPMHRAVHLLTMHQHIEGSEEEVWWRCSETARALGAMSEAQQWRERALVSLQRKLAWLSEPTWHKAFSQISWNQALLDRSK